MHATALIRIDMRGVGTKHEIGGEIKTGEMELSLEVRYMGRVDVWG